MEGVLPICIGQATKIVPFLTDTRKTYIAELSLGTATDTEDSQGEVIAFKEMTRQFSYDEIEKTLQKFKGEITQIPPMYSAVKVNGRKLYEYARNNIPVERPKRKVNIYELRQILDENMDDHHISLKIVCSKGTYIRTLCVNIGGSTRISRSYVFPCTDKNRSIF
ncbi:tRNA pseudouridine(55) synthase TruB [Virgibacillus halophilus]|uniref:tRNA pseudouridine(55) synthase n=1 Tax=Tigheibacillus halophilus TaxID=361280 RepID=A0ABU5CAY2_9BACI|nr:tRNA pseudouridine(55) synthase TruB [Virgibacillus halophilus]